MVFFFFQAEDGIRDIGVTGVQTCALPISATSQRALQSHASQFLGYTDIRGTGFVVAELSPYELDLDWEDLTEPDEVRPVLVQLGRATAKLHCVGDAEIGRASCRERV